MHGAKRYKIVESTLMRLGNLTPLFS